MTDSMTLTMWQRTRNALARAIGRGAALMMRLALWCAAHPVAVKRAVDTAVELLQ